MNHAVATMLCSLALCVYSGSTAAVSDPPLPFAPKRADFRGIATAPDVRHVADWAVDSRDHEGLPFLVIDKREARVYAFTADGRLIGAAPILLGRAIGDEFAPGVIDMDMYETSAWQRITPAGRFRAEQYRKPNGSWILWVDYDSAIALHKVLTNNHAEERPARLGASDPNQRRITYGCINVPVDFYERVIHPTFRRSEGIVYVLPETRAARTLFGSYDVPRVAASDVKADPAMLGRAPVDASEPREPDSPVPSHRRTWNVLPPASRLESAIEVNDRKV